MLIFGVASVKRADVAQKAEHFHGKEGVAGSIPAIGSRDSIVHQNHAEVAELADAQG